MIRRFRNKALEQLYKGRPKGIEAHLRKRTAQILLALQEATDPQEMNLPGLNLHELKGKDAGAWAVTVRQNWRITFRFEDGQATDVDFVDYH